MFKSKQSRLLCLLFALIFCFQGFGLSVSASDTENLIDSDLRNWENLYPDYTTVTKISDTPTIYRLLFRPETTETTPLNIRTGAVYNLSDLNTGTNYSFNFKIEDYVTVSSLNSGISESWFYKFKDYNGTLTLGLASYDANTDTFELIEDCVVTINKDNYTNFFGKQFTINFELGNVINPCLLIYYLDVNKGGNNVPFFISNVSLIDNDSAKEDGFLAKLFAWFQEKFDSIGQSFTNLGNKLTELKNSFLDSLSNLGDTIGSFFDEQLEGIIDFFRGFGNLILYFNWEGEYTNPFEREDSPIDKVSAFFDNLIEYVDSIGTSIENILDSITGGLHIFDEFTSRFPWLKGIAVFCLALIVITRFIGL